MEIIDALNKDKSKFIRNLKKMMKQKVARLKDKSYHPSEENFTTRQPATFLRNWSNSYPVVKVLGSLQIR